MKDLFFPWLWRHLLQGVDSESRFLTATPTSLLFLPDKSCSPTEETFFICGSPPEEEVEADIARASCCCK